MIVDDVTTELTPDNTLKIRPDICIVGAGAAGIAMALSLIDAKNPSNGKDLKVAVLESSRNNERQAKTDEQPHRYEDPDVQPAYFGLMQRSKATDLKQASAHEFFLRSRIRCFGGTTNCWEGWTQPLGDVDFHRVDVAPHCVWPLDQNARTELTKAYQTAMEYCSIGMFGIGNYDLRTKDNQKYWKDKAKEWGYRQDDIDMLTLTDDLRSQVVIRMGGNQYDPPYIEDGAWDFQNVWKDRLKAAKNVIVYRNANVRQVVLASGAVLKLNASTLVGEKGKAVVGQDFTVTATRFVLAASCVENARLLLYKTDLRKTHWGLGNYLMTHPLIRKAATFKTNNALADPVRLFYGFDLLMYGASNTPPNVFAVVTPQDKTLRDARLGNYRAWIGFGHREGVPSNDPPNQGTVDFNCEQWPNQANRVELSLPSEQTDPVFHDPVAKVTIELTDEDYRTIFTGLDAVGAALEAKGHAVTKSFTPFTDRSDIIVTGEHAMGATRMGTSPINAVVDSDCKVFQISNLYVTGGSVFPTGGWANPTLTIIALAVRLAQHLAKLK